MCDCGDNITIGGSNGVGVVSITWTSNSDSQPQGTPETTDTYTVLYSDGNTTTFVVGNGNNGDDGLDGDDAEVFGFNQDNTANLALVVGNNSIGPSNPASHPTNGNYMFFLDYLIVTDNANLVFTAQWLLNGVGVGSTKSYIYPSSTKMNFSFNKYFVNLLSTDIITVQIVVASKGTNAMIKEANISSIKLE